MAELTGGQALVQSIKREGVDTIFGLPGVQLDWAFDALYESRDQIKVYHTRHEQATSYMADGYARTTGKVGACLVVPGPGGDRDPPGRAAGGGGGRALRAGPARAIGGRPRPAATGGGAAARGGAA